jgi:hypothetical protein
MAVKKKTTEDLNLDNTQDTSNVFEMDDTTTQEVEETTIETKDIEAREESLPLSLVQKMMKEMEDKFMNQINKLTSAVRTTNEYSDDEYINDLQDDWLEIPVVFFAFSFNFSIHGDKKRGMEDEPPGGPVRFVPLIRTKKKGQKGIQVISVSSVKINSKGLVDYLRSHSQFGIAFYENMESAMNIDATWAQKMVEAQQSISRLSDMQVIARAKQEGISVTQSPEGMRKQLVEKHARESIDRQEKMLYGSIRSSVVDKQGRSIIEKTIG